MHSVARSLVAVIVCVPALALFFCGDAPGQSPLAKSALRFQEAQSLRQAYLNLAAANHDYDGHRARAMAAVRSTLKILDQLVLNEGTTQERAATVEGQAAVANAKVAAKLTPGVHENQPLSDTLLQQAGQTIGQVRVTMIANKQRKDVIKYVDTALHEINIALKIR